MKKFFFALIVGALIFAANSADAAKFHVLAEIDAYDFYQNLGYEVDCSHFDRADGKIIFRTILPEEPLSLSQDDPNVLIYAEPTKKSRIVEIDIYLQSDADKNLLTAFVTKVINALDPDAFQKNQAAIENNIARLINSNAPADVDIVLDAERKLNLYKEQLRGKVLAIFIEDARDAVNTAPDN